MPTIEKKPNEKNPYGRVIYRSSLPKKSTNKNRDYKEHTQFRSIYL